MTIAKKKDKLIAYQERLSEIEVKVREEERAITKEEQAEFDSILNESDSLRAELVKDEERAAKLSNLNEYLNRPVAAKAQTPSPAPNVEDKSYRNFGEWFMDPETIQKRTMSMGNASAGGVLVPDKFINDILSIEPESSIVRPRATIIPKSDPPDAKVTIPAFNQQGTRGVYGNMEVQWLDEGGEKPDNEPDFSLVELEPKELGGSTRVTDKLLRNYPALSAWVKMQYNKLVNGREEYQFLRGNGVGKPQGVLGCPAELTVTRNTAGSILFADVRAMLVKMLASSWGNAVWIANQSTLDNLINLVDTAGNTIFMVGDITKNVPTSLFGLPLVFTGKTPPLGTKGDLMLVDFSYYLINDGSGPYFADSPHVYFTTNKTVLKMFKMVDGRPWVNSSLLLEDETTIVSPIVSLV